MPDGNNWLFWIILIGGSVVFLFVPQLMARRRQKKREESLAVGDRVMTIGGFIGELMYIDFDKNLARIRLSDSLIVDILPGALSGKRVEESDSDPAVKENSED